MSILNKLTLAHLKENKKRTFLTGFSISMIVALLTAIVLFLSSAWLFVYKQTINANGDWHFKTNVISEKAAKDLSLANFVDSTTAYLTTHTVDKATETPYRTLSFEQDHKTLLSTQARIVKGRLPETADEIAITASFDKISQGDLLNNSITLTAPNGKSKIYKIVGLAMQYGTDFSYAYVNDKTLMDNQVSVFGKVKSIQQDFFKTMQHYQNSNPDGIAFEQFNTQILALHFVTEERNADTFTMLGTVIFIVIGIVVLIAITVISSAFSLSLSERLKQLGALSSIGTTKKQIRKMMLLEACWIGSVGISVGLIIGYIGSVISLHFFDHYAQTLLDISNNKAIHFEPVIYLPAILALIAFSGTLILVSAMVPAIRASRRSPIDNIKQVPFAKYIRLKRKRTTARQTVLTRLFGTPAKLARQYQKHHASRSRLVFLTLTISLITFNVIANLLFATQSMLSSQYSLGLKDSKYYQSELIAIQYNTAEETKKLTKDLSEIQNIQSFYTYKNWLGSSLTTNDQKIVQYFNNPDESEALLDVITLEPEQEKELLEKAGVSAEAFKTQGIIVTYDYKTKINNKRAVIKAIQPQTFKQKTIQVKFYRNHEIGEVKEQTSNLTIANNLDGKNLSFGFKAVATLVLSNEHAKNILGSENNSSQNIAVIQAKSEHLNTISEKLKTLYDNDIFIHNIHENKKAINSLLGMMQIIIYGFLSLISIICLTTLFNTMTSNIRLRQREFAILKSIGMTTKQIRQMLSIENLKTGTLSVISAIVMSTAITWFSLNSLTSSDTRIGTNGALILGPELEMPILPTVISSLVFIGILLLFNLFSMRQVFHRSLVEDIKNETL